MNTHFESAKAKLAHAKEHGTTAVLDTEEAAALYSMVGSMHQIFLNNKESTETFTPKEPKPLICTACYGSGYYDSCDSHGNNIRCGDCNGKGTVSEY